MKFRQPMQYIALTAAALFLSGCNSYGIKQLDSRSANNESGIGFHQARYDELSTIREFESCRDEAMELDLQARASSSTGRYLASARLLEQCESSIGADGVEITETERMKAYALTIQNYLKAGEMEKARVNLEQFSHTFEGRDLYYVDGSSFTETMRVLVGQVKPSDLGQFSLLNTNATLKSEMRRVRYWKRN